MNKTNQSKNQLVPFNESTSKKEVQNTALTCKEHGGHWYVFLCVCSLCIYFIFPDKVRIRDAGEKLLHSLKAHRRFCLSTGFPLFLPPSQTSEETLFM